MAAFSRYGPPIQPALRYYVGTKSCSHISDMLQTIFVPALISLILYVAFTYAIIPFYRQHRQRYSHYLPLNAISTRTSSFRERASDALMNFLLPTSWRREPRAFNGRYPGDDSDDGLFDDAEGEGMVGFDIDESRRQAIQRTGSGGPEEDRRLSRDLEEGFKDDSDDERGDESGART